MNFFRKLLLAYMICFIGINPVVYAGGITVDTSAPNKNQASLDKAGNNVTIVNIAAPNSSGLSHNKFTDFNVSSSGVILNNANSMTQTQLGGIINGNSNFNNRAASLILNEVTSSNRSILRGYTEIGGQSAEYILANPNGITCNGCGFINTPKVTLSTGIPGFEDGQFKYLDVYGGDVLIEGLGLNANNIDSFDIIAKSIKLNANLFAKDLSLITGKNRFNYYDRSILILDSSADNTSFSIDASLLGGMYANQIRLIGTQDGVGVNIQTNMAADAGDILISADGDITFNKSTATGDIIANSNSGNIYLEDDASAGANIRLQATQSINITNDVMEAGGLMVAFAKDVSFSSNNLNVGDIFYVESDTFNNYGSILSQNSIIIDSEFVNNHNKLVTAESIEVQAKVLVNSGSMAAVDTLQLNLSELHNDGTILTENGVINIDATELISNSGNIQSINNNILLTSENSFTNSGLISTSQNIQLASIDITNTGDIMSSNSLLLESDTLLNDGGNITAENNLGFFINNRLENSGLIQTNSGLLTFSSLDKFINSGRITTIHNLSLNTSLFHNFGDLISLGSLSIESDTFENTEGTVISQDNMNIVAGNSFTNSGDVISSKDLNINTSSISNTTTGRLVANIDMTINVTGNITNQGVLQSDSGSLHIDSSASLDNSGVILSVQETSINSGDIENTGILQSADTININANTLNNTDKLMSNNEVTIVLNNTMTNSGLIQSALDNINLSVTDSITNTGQIISKENVNIQSTTLTNENNITAFGSQTVSITDLINNGKLASVADMNITATGSITNNDVIQSDSGSLTINGDATITNSGQMISAQSMDIDADSIDNSGSLISLNTLDIASRVLTNNSSGRIIGHNSLLMNIQQSMTNEGLLQSDAGNLNISTSNLVNHGEISSAGNMQIDSVDITNSNDIVSMTGLTMNGSSLNNSDQIIAGSNLVLNLSSVIQNSGTVQSDGGNVNVSANSSITNEGNFVSYGNMQIDTGNLINHSTINSLSNLTIDTSNVNNYGFIQSRGFFLLNMSNNLTNNSGAVLRSDVHLMIDTLRLINATSATIESLNDLTLTLGSAYTNDDILQAGGTLTINSAYRFDNTNILAAGENLHLFVKSHKNTSNILALGDIVIAKDTALHKNDFIINESGTIESFGGNIVIRTKDLKNISDSVPPEKDVIYKDCYQIFDATYSCFAIETIEAILETDALYDVPSYGRTETWTDTIPENYISSLSSKIISNNNIDINANEITNSMSYIGANGNINLSGINLLNHSLLVNKRIRLSNYSVNWGGSYRFTIDGPNLKSDVTELLDVSEYATIEAKGSVNINMSGSVDNEAGDEKTFKEGLPVTMSSLAITVSGSNLSLDQEAPSELHITGTFESVTNEDSIHESHQQESLANIPGLSSSIAEIGNSGSLFIINDASVNMANPDDTHHYLIETNPQLTIFNSFISSSYMLDMLNYDPEEQIRFFGDGLVESRLLRNAIFEQTGSRYIYSDVANEADQYRRLMDNAVAAQEELKLSVGMTLTKDQVAALTHDIVWMEEKEVMGEKVLVPVLYLTQASLDNIDLKGSIIRSGGDMNIMAGYGITNTGQIRSGSTMNIVSDTSITNIGGTLHAVGATGTG